MPCYAIEVARLVNVTPCRVGSLNQPNKHPNPLQFQDHGARSLLLLRAPAIDVYAVWTSCYDNGLSDVN